MNIILLYNLFDILFKISVLLLGLNPTRIITNDILYVSYVKIIFDLFDAYLQFLRASRSSL